MDFLNFSNDFYIFQIFKNFLGIFQIIKLGLFVHIDIVVRTHDTKA